MKQTIFLVFALSSNFIYSQNGSLDLEFGDKGMVATSFSDYRVQATSIAEQPDGKIVVVGNGTKTLTEHVVAVRYLANGEIDLEFANDGKLVLDLSIFFTVGREVVVDANNNIFLGGYFGNEDFHQKAFVVKLDMNGDLDPTFADNGIWRSERNGTREIMGAMQLVEDDKILLAGHEFQSGSKSLLIRLNEDGSLDDDFGLGGYAEKVIPSGYITKFVGLFNNGSIITGGQLGGGGRDIILIKFKEDGEVDTNFGVNGVLVDAKFIDEYAFDMAIQNDNKIIVSYASEDSYRNFGLVRYNWDGSLDEEYGEDGRVITNFSVLTNSARSIVLQEDQKIIQSGFILNMGQLDYAMVRFDSNGNIDPSFGNEGKVITDFGLDELCEVSILQADGKLLCGGIYREATIENGSIMVARYLTGITVHTSDLAENIREVKVTPNPSTSLFNVSFNLNTTSVTSIDLLKSDGSLMQSLVGNKRFEAGEHELEVNLNSDLIQGLYFLKIQTESGYTIEKILLVK